ncbi:hypothetical protein LWI28_009341 [Acer negundo]|uniref:Uncharacterized protein n=1 Tax=Acer negundo TaxID=4023 RepID=A0AAD5JKA4_ACENE|nr:hypothetical protein LWI28_009341 [Acer negundo]
MSWRSRIRLVADDVCKTPPNKAECPVKINKFRQRREEDRYEEGKKTPKSSEGILPGVSKLPVTYNGYGGTVGEGRKDDNNLAAVTTDARVPLKFQNSGDRIRLDGDKVGEGYVPSRVCKNLGEILNIEKVNQSIPRKVVEQQSPNPSKIEVAVEGVIMGSSDIIKVGESTIIGLARIIHYVVEPHKENIWPLEGNIMCFWSAKMEVDGGFQKSNDIETVEVTDRLAKC